MSRRSAASRVVVLAAAVSLLSIGPSGAGSASGVLPTPRPASEPVAAAPGDQYESPGQTTLVSYDATGAQLSGSIAPAISGDGRYVVFYAPYLINTTNVGQILLRDRVQKVTRVVARGRFVGQAVITVVYVASPTISRDGRWVAFTSGPASNPNSINLWNVQTGETTVAVNVTSGGVDQPSLSDGGRFVAFRSFAQLSPQDLNAGQDVYVKDVNAGGYDLASRPDPAWPQCYTTMNSNPSISADGRYVAYDTTCGPDGPGSREIELRDRTAGKTALISKDASGNRGKGDSSNAAISADGSTIAFESASSTLVPGDTNGTPDVFVWQTPGNALDRISVSSEGGQANGTSGEAAISGNGRIVAFSSDASTLVPGDTSGPIAGLSSSPRDVFVHDIVTGRTSRISFGLGPSEPAGTSLAPWVNDLGDAVAFQSAAPNLVQGDLNKNVDVFVRDRLPRLTLTPNPVDFGTTSPGATPDPQTVTVSNSGSGPTRIASATIDGAAGYKVAAEDCTSQAVYPGDTCSLSIAFTPSVPGQALATLRVVDNLSNVSSSARLTALVADYAIQLSPKVGPPGLVVQVTGHGFTPGQTVDLSWSPGITARPLQPVVVGADGTFKAQMLVLYHDQIGPRKLIAAVTIGGRKVTTQADFTVVQGSSGPPRNNSVPLPSGWAPPFVDKP